MCNLRKIIKEKINQFVETNNLEAKSSENVPMFFQEIMLLGGFDDDMVDIFVLALLDDEETLKDFLGEELYYSKEFSNYISLISQLN